MTDEAHVMYMYRKIQAVVSTTDLKTFEHIYRLFRKAIYNIADTLSAVK